jgi:putative Ca2+/H+ antiporter (TMEM165/GDT1 family)
MITAFLIRHSDAILLLALLVLVYVRKFRSASVGHLVEKEFNKIILATLIILFVSVAMHLRHDASGLATEMADNVKTVVGALLILINARKDAPTTEISAAAPQPGPTP